MAEIIFAPIEEEDSTEECILFNAEHNGKTIECAVTYEALTDHYEAEYSDPLFAFMTVRAKVEKLAEKMITDGQSVDGKIIITTKYVSDNGWLSSY